MVTIDVSEPILLRKRLGRAALSLKIIGLLIALSCLVISEKYLGIWLSLSLSITVFIVILLVARKMASGNELAIKITGLLLLYYFFVLVDATRKALRHDIGGYTIIGMLIYIFPIYFILRSLITFYFYNKRYTDRKEEKMTWVFGKYTELHPAFVNKRSLGLYFLLMLTPLPLVYWGLLRFTMWEQINSEDLYYLIGNLTGRLLFFFFILFLTASLYRRARRHALLPAKELRKKQHRPIVLYLRSFFDDQLKMRARAANGRSWLERIVKVTFEEVLVDHLWRYGPVVAVGKPGDKLPPLGAARDYLPDESWQQKVEQLMNEADIIVTVLGRTEGLAWEITKVIELGLLSKLIFVLPPRPEAALRIRWDYLCDIVNKIKGEVGGIKLPHDVDLKRLRAIASPEADKVFGITAEKRDDWTYETVLDACVELIKNPASLG
jgi:hypothetical protein